MKKLPYTGTTLLTITEFASKIGATKQWVHWKVRKHIAQVGYTGTLIFYNNKNHQQPLSVELECSKPGAQVLLREVKS